MDLLVRCKEHLMFKKEEWRVFFIVVPILSFILSFRSWGVGEVDIQYGVKMFIATIVMVTIVFLLNLLLQRIVALKLGFSSLYKFDIVSVMASLMITILTNGWITPVLPGALEFKIVKRYRLGKWPMGMNYEPLSATGIMALLGHLVLALIVQSLLPDSTLAMHFVKINLLFAIFGILPLPSTVGLQIFYGSRLYYGVTLGVVIGASLLVWLNANWILTIIGAIVLGIISWVCFLTMIES